MADEAILVTRKSVPIGITVADGSGIEKGAILILSDPNTAATHTGAVAQVVGIAAEEKIANDGRTQISYYDKGRFKVRISGNVGLGDPLVTDTSLNHLKSGASLSAATISRSRIIGRALEDGTTGQTILMELGIETGGSGMNA